MFADVAIAGIYGRPPFDPNGLGPKLLILVAACILAAIVIGHC